MHRFRLVFLLLLVSTSLFASDLTVKVADPQGATVPGARIALYLATSRTPVGLGVSDNKGAYRFHGLAGKDYRVEVSAPGFAPWTGAATIGQELMVEARLQVAGPDERVVVTATNTPVPADISGATVAVLDQPTLETMQPVTLGQAVTFLPGSVVSTTGRRGAQATLFVRGGESNYNKVIIDGVPVNDPGGFIDLGVIPANELERIEFVRGAASSLHGSDAMTSTLQLWSRTGTTRSPQLRLGADGGNLSTGHGFASLAGARQWLDYNLFVDQFNTDGQGINDEYSNSSQGANLGFRLSNAASLRVRTRHSNSRVGVQSFWRFNGVALLPPESAAFARQNNFLGSAELVVAAPARWIHRFTGFEYNHRRFNRDSESDRGCGAPVFDCGSESQAKFNRAGLEYQAEYAWWEWMRTVFGYQFENENGVLRDLLAGSAVNGTRQNHGVYAQQVVAWRRFSAVAGIRYVNHDAFGGRWVPRASAAYELLRGGGALAGTQLRYGYSEGIKAPSFEESFGSGSFVVPNPDLRAESVRSHEAGVQQRILGGRYSVHATYFHNAFRDQIDFAFDLNTFTGQFVNLNRTRAQGAEFEIRGRLRNDLTIESAYVHTSTKILEAPTAFDPLVAAGRPLLRRPKHSGMVRLTYVRPKWGGNVGGSFVGRRPDSDFLGFGIDHADGYARIDVGGWYAIHRNVTGHVDIGNLLNRDYNEAVGFPALKFNFRAGLRFRIGGE